MDPPALAAGQGAITPSMTRLKTPPRAAIFDLDGVLLDTEPLYTLAANRVLAPWGKSIDWALKAQTMGGHPLEGARIVLKALRVPLTPEEYVNRRKQELLKLFEKPPAMPGAEMWLATLREANIPFGIGTSSTRELCNVKFRAHPFIQAVTHVVCGDEVPRRKPAPDIFVEVARRLGHAPSDCLVFEDSPAGVRAARAANMQVIAIGAAELDKSLLAEADWIVSGYAELSLQSIGL